MSESKTVEILKEAILLEKRGVSFYMSVANQANNTAVKDFFSFMAEEEKIHTEVLNEQFLAFQNNGCFNSFNSRSSWGVSSKILEREIIEKISSAGFEAAAIGAAIAMEERAIRIYSNRAEETSDPEEKKMYKWLSSWEKIHLNQLVDIDKALTEKIWFDNHFWPF